MKTFLPVATVCLFCCATAFAQFTGPSQTDRPTTVAHALEAPIGTYVTVTGTIVAHLGEDYYRFRDATGEIRVEIEPPVWRNRKIGPDDAVRLVAEVDRNLAGTRYLWVDSLEPFE